VLRNVASGIGLSAQQVSNDWSDVNYSSARGALLEAWKTLGRRRHDFAEGFAAPIRIGWLEEAHAVDDLPLPNGAPKFVECRGAYARATWVGPGVGWVDPVAESQGAIMRMDGALSTLQDECSQQGLDFEEVLEQRRYELQLFDEYKIPRPEWAGELVGLQSEDAKGGAQKAAKKPEAV
jgi:capsid protein